MRATIQWTEEKKEQAIQRLTKYFELYGSGEMIAQDDEANIEAMDVLIEIADDILIENEGIIFDEE